MTMLEKGTRVVVTRVTVPYASEDEAKNFVGLMGVVDFRRDVQLFLSNLVSGGIWVGSTGTVTKSEFDGYVDVLLDGHVEEMHFPAHMFDPLGSNHVVSSDLGATLPEHSAERNGLVLRELGLVNLLCEAVLNVVPLMELWSTNSNPDLLVTSGNYTFERHTGMWVIKGPVPLGVANSIFLNGWGGILRPMGLDEYSRPVEVAQLDAGTLDETVSNYLMKVMDFNKGQEKQKDLMDAHMPKFIFTYMATSLVGLIVFVKTLESWNLLPASKRED